MLIIGTHKGLFTFTSDHDRSRWQLGGPYLNGLDVTHATLDPRSLKLYATANDPWFGNRLAVSADLGASWQDGFGGPKFAAGAGKTVARLWHIEPGWPTAPGVLFCGVDPGALFRSQDGGETWIEITEGLPSDFGLMIAAHPREADVAYVLPLQGAEFRCPPEGKLRVFRTTDAGQDLAAADARPASAGRLHERLS